MPRRFSNNVKPYRDFYGKVIGLARGKRRLDRRTVSGAEPAYKGTQVPYTFAKFGSIKFRRSKQ